jgi:hypothetical protein
LDLYRPRNPQASDLWRVMDQHFETFQQVYDERFQTKYGFWRPGRAKGDILLFTARRRSPDGHGGRLLQ